ncbi:RsbU1 [Desulforapulum autotrophicum HRM2]|uniref:RsbU1 n=1 Tax=Desulforapulum autotrophicum (strain ATCC 43914 / DSM 3382 / VKM B-1955 / HRM2) TaxID=177437 RepID=C0QCF8_DESAH|nr:SpoIIE family protein phosphatase [Desulforapulum autotrophicum]ACN17175.1 RsbU1 [Desulforapulum autotrophicum HRM2]
MLEAMPSVELGATIVVSLFISLALRRPVLERYVEAAPLQDQTLRQFIVEYVLFTLAGLIAIIANKTFYHIDYASGSMFLIGFLAFGFFIALDLSLERSRRRIEQRIASPLPAIIEGTLRPMTRTFFMVALMTFVYVMLVIILIISRDLAWIESMDNGQMATLISITTQTIFKEISFIMVLLLVMVVNILLSYSRNLKLLFDTETSILKAVTDGDLSRFVPVATNDEFGAIAGYTNRMILSLRDRIRILTTLRLATEVQKNMLPQSPPICPGVDIAGAIIYCQEVGGDCFDYLTLPDGRLGIAVTDSAGHGVGAALYMTTARACMRFATESYQGPALLVDTVNRHLTRDTRDTGRFTTLFFLEIDPVRHTLKWVRAGHEPALLFDPETADFSPLKGEGMALGVDKNMRSKAYDITGWKPGAILLIFSDGLKESRNKNGEMYGTDRMQQVIQANREKSAQTITQQLINDIERFSKVEPVEDDVTIVIIKLR